VNGLWQQDGVFCVGLSAFNQYRAIAFQHGFRWMAPILTHDPAAIGNKTELERHAATDRAEGWKLAGWGTYGQAATPETDAALAVGLVKELGLDGWVANGEAWAEGANISYSNRFIAEWKAEGGTGPLAVSCLSSDTANWAREFDYEAWLAIGSAVMPQVYGNEHPGYTVAACLGMLEKAHVPQAELNLTFGTYESSGGRPLTVPYTDYQGWSGPRTVYVGERTAVDGWPKLARVSARPGTPPKEEPPVPPAKKWWEVAYPRATKPAYDGDLPYALYPPDAAPGKTPTPDCPLTVAIKRAVSRGGRWPWGTFDDTFSNAFSHGKAGGNVADSGVAGVQRQQGIQASGWLGKGTFDALNWSFVPAGLPNAGAALFDGPALNLIRQAAKEGPPKPPDPPEPNAKIPDLGPVCAGGKSVLAQDLTHATSGISLYPAFDDGFAQGVTVIAPEPLTVTRSSSSNPGEAFYADGASGLRYWFGHLTATQSAGVKFAKGAKVGVTCHNDVGGGPHVHVGINVERLWGAGKQFEHHTNYTHGAPTVGEQLAKATA
jgi:hypothetical protein